MKSKCIPGCKVYTSYIRINHLWVKVGQYHTLCGKFSRLMKEETKTEKINKPEDGLSESIRYCKSLQIVPNTLQQVSDKELSELCRSITV